MKEIRNVESGETSTAASLELPQLKTLLRGGGVAFGGQVLVMLLNVILQFMLARFFGAEILGDLSLGLTVVNLASVVVMFGLHRGVLRYVAHYSGKDDQARMTGALVGALRVLTVTSMLVTTAMLFSSDFLAESIFKKPELGRLLRILGLSIPFLALVAVFSSYLQALKRIRDKVFVELLQPLFSIVGLGLVTYAIGTSAVGASYILTGSVLAAVILAIILVWRHYPYPLRGASTAEKPKLYIRTMLDFSWPLLLTGILSTANVQSETLVLGALSTSSQVGIYVVALKATSFIKVFLSALDVIFAPMIANLYARGEHTEMDRLFKTVTRWAFTASMPIFSLLFVFSEEVTQIFGADFVAGAPLLRVLAVSQMIFIITGPSGWLLTMTGHPRYNLLNMLLTLATALGLDFMLIPQYGAMGAAIAGAISIMLVNTLRLIEVYVLLRLQPYTLNYLKPLLAGIMSSLIVFWIDLSVMAVWRMILLSPILVALYALFLYILRFEATDVMLMRTILLRIGLPARTVNRIIGALDFSRSFQAK